MRLRIRITRSSLIGDRFDMESFRHGRSGRRKMRVRSVVRISLRPLPKQCGEDGQEKKRAAGGRSRYRSSVTVRSSAISLSRENCKFSALRHMSRTHFRIMVESWGSQQ